jgi:hypothetical protein
LSCALALFSVRLLREGLIRRVRAELGANQPDFGPGRAYHASVRDGFDGDWPYERLAVIYRRRNDCASEIATLERAIEVFESLMARSPRVDVPLKLAKFRERLHAVRQLAGKAT